MEVKFNSSDKVTNLLAAYNKFQALDLVAVKHGSNPHFKSTFAKLPDILELVRDPLSDNGLCVIQMPLGGTDDVSLLCRLTHTSGEFFQWVYSAPLSQKDVQKVCATITYLRRTSLLAVLGIPDQDFDGNDAVITQEQYTPTLKQDPPRKDMRDSPLSTAPKGIGISEPASKYIYIVCKETGYSKEEVSAFIKAKWNVDHFIDLTWKQLHELVGDRKTGATGLMQRREMSINQTVEFDPLSDF